MSKIEYVTKRFLPKSMRIIEETNEIIADYLRDGLTLTVRQLFYRFVSRASFANTPDNYEKLVSIVSDARLAGLIDWEVIEDRTRGVVANANWSDPADAMRWLSQRYRRDLWDGQDCRVEVWVEKEALAGVIEMACGMYDVPWLACRGYTSQSEMWRASQRIERRVQNGQGVRIVYVGDHDPSGIDMSRDVHDRLEIFLGSTMEDVEIFRAALNMDQVKKYRPPPNPARVTDSRFVSYQSKFGDESWELDALEPLVLVEIIRDAIRERLDVDKFERRQEVQEKETQDIRLVGSKWDAALRVAKKPPRKKRPRKK